MGNANSKTFEELTPAERERFFQTRKILCGTRVDEVDHNTLVSAETLLLIEAEGIIDEMSPITKYEKGRLSSAREVNLRKAGWASLGFKGNIPFAEIALGASHTSSRASGAADAVEYSYEIDTHCRYKFYIHHDKITLHPNFLKELKNAIAVDGEECKRLKAVFRRWGHVLPERVAVGGERRLFRKTTQHTSIIQEETRDEISAGINISAIPVGVNAQGGGAGGQVNKEDDSSDLCDLTWTGGDPEYHNDTMRESWIKSLNDYENWQVINRMEPTPIIDLLPSTLRNQILTYVDEPVLEGRWRSGPTEVEEIGCKHFSVFQPILTSGDRENGWRILGQSTERKVLIVRAINANNCLYSIEKNLKAWTFTEGLHSHYFRHHSTRCEFRCLGSSFDRNDDPNKYPAGLMAVKTEYLAPATYKNNPVLLKKAYKHGALVNSIWSIEPVLKDGSPTTIPLNLFFASKKGVRDDPPLGLKIEYIKILNPEMGPESLKVAAANRPNQPSTSQT